MPGEQIHATPNPHIVTDFIIACCPVMFVLDAFVGSGFRFLGRHLFCRGPAATTASFHVHASKVRDAELWPAAVVQTYLVNTAQWVRRENVKFRTITNRDQRTVKIKPIGAKFSFHAGLFRRSSFLYYFY